MVLYDVVNIQKNNADNHHTAELQEQTAIDHGDADINSISQMTEDVNTDSKINKITVDTARIFVYNLIKR